MKRLGRRNDGSQKGATKIPPNVLSIFHNLKPSNKNLPCVNNSSWKRHKGSI